MPPPRGAELRTKPEDETSNPQVFGGPCSCRKFWKLKLPDTVGGGSAGCRSLSSTPPPHLWARTGLLLFYIEPQDCGSPHANHAAKAGLRESGFFALPLGGEIAKLQARWAVCFWISRFSGPQFPTLTEMTASEGLKVLGTAGDSTDTSPELNTLTTALQSHLAEARGGQGGYESRMAFRASVSLSVKWWWRGRGQNEMLCLHHPQLAPGPQAEGQRLLPSVPLWQHSAGFC